MKTALLVSALAGALVGYPIITIALHGSMHSEFDQGWAMGSLNKATDLYKFTCGDAAFLMGKGTVWIKTDKKFWDAAEEDYQSKVEKGESELGSIEGLAIAQAVTACDYLADEGVRFAQNYLTDVTQGR